MYIQTQSELEKLIPVLRQFPALAFDTEFFWERTYYPVLGLIQIAADEQNCWLIDTISIKDLSPLGEILASETIVKILHDAPQDLWILRRACHCEAVNLFDTRLAAGFAGLDSTCSLKKLLFDLFAVDLAKDQTRSDWTRRPLSPEQIQYAGDDVIYLPKTREELLRRCSEPLWMAEEMKRLETITPEKTPEQLLQRIRSLQRIPALQQAVLREFLAWREETARRLDRPRAHVIQDETLFGFLRGENPSHRYQEALLEIRKKTENGPVAPLKKREAVSKQQVDGFLNQIRAVCVRHKIDPALAGSRTDVENYLSADAAEKELSIFSITWRKMLLSDGL